MAERGLLLEASGLKDEPDEDFDAFNDDTFGGVSEEWVEDAHEELAQITEGERLALQQSQDFFGFDGGDEGEELEPLEESNGDLSHALEERLHLRRAVLPDDPAILNVLPVMPPPPPAHFMLPPHASAGPPTDPAIMSVGKLPSMAPQQHMSHMHQMQGMQHVVPQMAIPMHLMPAPHGMPPSANFLPAMRSMPPPPMHHQVHLNAQHVPPREHRSMQDLEQEMMRQLPRFNQHQQQQQQHHHQQQRHHHQYQDGRQQQHYGGAQYQNHHRDQYQHRNRFDDKNRETFGEDFVSDNTSRGGYHSDNSPRGHYSENSSRNFQQRDPPRGGFHSQRALMPGHVHALGILRDARERLHQSTGNPQLDLEMERREEHDQGWQREYYNRSTDDEYSGLMTPRERQWIINIQLQQLKCENPFLDDYYYTVYNQKKAAAAEESTDEEGRQLKRTEEGPQLLLQDCGGEGGRDEYRPVQFSNSLGKLQAVTVKAPRRIIDVAVAKEDGGEGGGPSSAQKESRRYKSTLMEIERMYGLLIEAEDCEKKLAALPTNTALRKQVQQERELAVQRLCATLASESRIKRYLMVRKGKTLLKRSLRMLDDASLQLFCTNLFQLFPLVVRRDKDDRLLNSFWTDLKKHLRMTSFELLQLYMKLLNAGSTSPSPSPKLSYSTFKQALTNSLGTSVVLVMLNQLGRIHSSLSTEETKDAKNILRDLMQAVAESPEIAAPLEVINVQAIESLMEKDEFHRLEQLGTTAAL